MCTLKAGDVQVLHGYCPSLTACINCARELSSGSSHFYFPDCFPPISTWLFSTSSNSSPKSHFRVALQPLSSTSKLCPLLTPQSVFFCFHFLGHSSAHHNPAVYIQYLPPYPVPYIVKLRWQRTSSSLVICSSRHSINIFWVILDMVLLLKNSIYTSFMMVKFLHFILFQNRKRSIIKLSVGMKSVLVLIDWQHDSRVSISLPQWNMPAS